MHNVKIYGQKIYKATEGSSGFDICNLKDISIKPQELVMVETGLFIEMPSNLEAQIRPRSSLGKKKIIIPNSPGTIDSDYRGEIKILLMNLSDEIVIFPANTRIAQMVFMNYITPNIKITDIANFNKTNRGSGGFGSTGLTY